MTVCLHTEPALGCAPCLAGLEVRSERLEAERNEGIKLLRIISDTHPVFDQVDAFLIRMGGEWPDNPIIKGPNINSRHLDERPEVT